jgi:1-aminocyclopropane-1-carboxylate deaminase/D-cysteine desulfhydrase-like pyridoxal-dependent ACC family enzyme
MSDAVIVAIIAGGGSVIAAFVVRFSLKKPLQEIHLAVNSNLAKMTAKVDTLEKVTVELRLQLAESVALVKDLVAARGAR